MATLSYCLYELTPLKKLNRFQSNVRQGVLFKLEDNGVGYVDYHPWHELGDLPIEVVIDNLKTHSKSEIANFLIASAYKDKQRVIDHIEMLPFKNHQIFTPDEQANSLDDRQRVNIAKVKISNNVSFEVNRIKEILKQVDKIRLDANNGLTLQQLISLWSSLNETEKMQVDYIEDPVAFDMDSWEKIRKLGVPLALDRWPNMEDVFLENGNQFVSKLTRLTDFMVFKPNISAFNKVDFGKPIIFSSYMGHDLGRIQCYFELLEHGDLELVHGIHTPNLYCEQLELFEYKAQLCTPILENFKIVYDKLEQLKWSYLCQLT